MSADFTIDPKFEIGHVLFIDIVGYSKLLIGEQSELVRELKEVVAASEQVRVTQEQGKLVSLPTGDGVALVFRDSAEAPAQSALEIAGAIKKYPQLRLRMGIHSGPVNVVTDLNNRANVAGAGINVAQRVMDCGDAGHILVSKHVAEDLEHYARWQSYLHELGECEVKHGARISLVNLYGDSVGNADVPEKIKQARREQARASRDGRKRILVATSIVAAAVLGIGYWVFHQRRANDFASIPVKSIAVLPFQNLSPDPQNAFFADGVQDEILTNLARIGDLKVISRTSVMQYKAGTARNARTIAQALGVSHLLEGSVQRAGGKVRISAQLIDARNDTHLWAQTYDRNLADVFGIQSEIAKAIAQELQVKLSPSEKNAIERPPTSDLASFDLYAHAKAILQGSLLHRDDLLHAIDLLDQAIARDPAFFLAYCEVASAHGHLYFFAFDHTTQRISLAEAAVRQAEHLRPDAGETHLARAEFLYRCRTDYEKAGAELELARHALPNRSEVFELLGYIDRRQGRWDDSTRSLEKALQLDPRNFNILQQIAGNYQQLRRYADMVAVLDRALVLHPEDSVTRVFRGFALLDWRADSRPLHETIHKILSENPGAAEQMADAWFLMAICERDPNEISQALKAVPREGLSNEGVNFPKSWCEGLAAHLMGDTPGARVAFARAHSELERSIGEQPDWGPAWCVLGMIDAFLGHKADAIREGRRALELLPVEKDPINGALLMKYLAFIYAWTGDHDRAIDQLKTTLQRPVDLSYGELRLYPHWDPLRGDPRFEKLVASLAPKD